MKVEKEAGYWKSTKAAIAKMLGLSDDTTDTELVDAVLETDKEAKKTDEAEDKTEKEAEKKVEKTEKEVEKKEDTEGGKTEKNSEIDELKKSLADVVKIVELQGGLIKLQGENMKKITEFQAKRATGGEKEIEDKNSSGRKYVAKDAPNFED